MIFDEALPYEELGEALARLSPERRAVVTLHYWLDYTTPEIAEVLGVKRDKVKALVFQAREGLGAFRAARMTPCHEIREQLATARGGALRRGPLRRHLLRVHAGGEGTRERLGGGVRSVSPPEAVCDERRKCHADMALNPCSGRVTEV